MLYLLHAMHNYQLSFFFFTMLSILLTISSIFTVLSVTEQGSNHSIWYINYLQVKTPGGTKILGGMPNSLFYSGIPDSRGC